MTQISHERCSELLALYVKGRLEPPVRADVIAHLGGCLACSRELTALEALSPVEFEPLSGMERDDLARAVRAAISTQARPGLFERFGRRMNAALGAVALFAIILVGVISWPDQQDRPQGAAAPAEDSGAGGDTAQTEQATTTEVQAETGDQASGAQPAAKHRSGTDNSTSSAAAGATLKAGVGNTFLDTTVATGPFAREGLDLPALQPATLAGAPAAADQQTSLYSAAQDPQVRRFIDECTQVTISTSPFPLTATSAVYYPRDEVLVIAFIWTDESTGTVNFELRGWRDGRCDRVTPIYRRGIAE
jgi:hypothetical protein